MLKIENPGKNKFGEITQEDIEKIEKLVDGKFPDDYREFMLKYNGCRDVNVDFEIFNQDLYSRWNGVMGDGVTDFFSINKVGLSSDPSCSTLEWNIKNYEEILDFTGEPRIPKSVLPIASANGGNLYCISLRKDDYGVIYYWDHEFEGEDYKNMTKVADSFTDFLYKIEEPSKS